MPVPVEVETVDGLWEWTVLAEGEKGPDGVGPPLAYDGTWLVTAGFMDTVFVTKEGGTRSVLHEMPEDTVEWLLDDGYLANGRWVLVQHEGEREGDYQIWLYDLESRERELIEEFDGTPYRHAVPQLSLDGDRLAWNTSLDDGRTCVRIRNLVDGSTFEAVCSADELETISWPSLQWPVLTYSTEPSLPPKDQAEAEAACLQVWQLNLPDGEPRLLEVEPCWGFQGAGDQSLAVWFEMEPLEGDVFRSPIYGRDSSGVTYLLGLGEVGSARVCQGRAIWNTQLPGSDEIRSWAPGQPVTVIYRPPADGSWGATAAPSCADGWIATDRAYSGVGPSADQVIAARLPEHGGTR